MPNDNCRSTTLKSLGKFVLSEIHQHILCRRWLLPLLMLTFIAYMKVDAVFAINSTPTQTVIPMKPFIWDIMFHSLFNPNIVFYFLIPFFLFLIGGFLPEPDFGQSTLLRLRSRGVWWTGKMLTLLVSVVVYLGQFVLLLVAFALLYGIKWSWEWGPVTYEYLQNTSLSIMQISPCAAFLLSLSLLALGLFWLGLVAIIIAQIFNRSWAAFAGGVAIEFASLIAYYAYVMPPFSLGLFYMHMLLQYHNFGIENSPYPGFGFSYLYWAVAIGICLWVSYSLAQKQNFYHKNA